MSYFIAPAPYRMARRLARLAEMEPVDDTRHFTLPADLHEQEDAYVLKTLLPGMKAEQISIQILENVVTVEGKFEDEQGEFLMRELPHGSFRRTLHLPATLDASKSNARLEDGVLTLTLPKAESARPKIVKVAVK